MLYRWTDEKQARRCFSANRMTPTWNHFVPQLQAFRKGICMAPHPSSWRGDYTVCFVFDETKLEKLRRYDFDGHAVYCASDALRWAYELGGMSAFNERLDSVMKKEQNFYENITESFFTGTISKLASRLVEVVLHSPPLEAADAMDSWSSAFGVRVRHVNDNALKIAA